MKKIINLLYAGSPLPDGLDRRLVALALEEIDNRFTKAMNDQYLWLAACTAAVEGGRWGGERRRRRRVKLAEVGNALRVYLGHSPLDLEKELGKQWDTKGLYYGYSAIGSYSAASGVGISEVCFIGGVLSGSNFLRQGIVA